MGIQGNPRDLGTAGGHTFPPVATPLERKVVFVLGMMADHGKEGSSHFPRKHFLGATLFGGL